MVRVLVLVEEHGAEPSAVKDAVLRMGALNWSGFFAAQPDAPAKLAGFAFAFEHLEIGGYEQLKRVARRARDEANERETEASISEERAAAAASSRATPTSSWPSRASSSNSVPGT